MATKRKIYLPFPNPPTAATNAALTGKINSAVAAGVTNAPVTIFAGGWSRTATNVLYAGSSITVDQH